MFSKFCLYYMIFLQGSGIKKKREASLNWVIFSRDP